MERIKSSVSRYTSNDKLDIFIMCEMALTGYTFKNKDDIKPFVEKVGKGVTFEFCSQLAI